LPVIILSDCINWLRIQSYTQ